MKKITASLVKHFIYCLLITLTNLPSLQAQPDDSNDKTNHPIFYIKPSATLSSAELSNSDYISHNPLGAHADLGFIAPLSRSWDWGAEVGYGTYGSDVFNATTPHLNRFYSAFNIDAVFYYHLLQNVSFFTKAGLGYLLIKQNNINTPPPYDFSLYPTHSNQTGLLVGAGMDYKMTRLISIGAEYVYFATRHSTAYDPSHLYDSNVVWATNNPTTIKPINSLQLYLRVNFNGW